MSLQHLAEKVRAKGRNGDTELLHVTKGELGGLNALARAMYGQDLPNNPYTGLPEANFLKKLLPTLAGAAASFFGGPAAGAAVGAALGGYQAHRAGGDTLAGAIAGGLGGYGGGQLVSGLNAAGAGAMPTGAGAAPVAAPVDTANAAAALGGAATPTPIPPPTAPTSGVSWENLKRGIGALGTEEGRTAFVGTAAEKGKPATGMGGSPYGALIKAATPAIVNAAGYDTDTGGKGTQGRRATPQKYEGQWVMRDGRPFFETRNVTEEKHAAGGRINTSKGVTDENVFAYLMGEAPLFKAQVTPEVAGVGVPHGTGGGSGGGGSGSGSGGGDGGGDGGGGSVGTTGGEAGSIGQGAGSVTSSAPSASTVGTGIGIAGTVGLGIPGLGLAANATGLSQGIADAIANQEGIANQASVASVSPEGMSQAGLAAAVDSAPTSGETQGTAAATTGTAGTGGAAAAAASAAASAAAAAGQSDAAQGAASQAAADAAIGGMDADGAAAAGAAAAAAADSASSSSVGVGAADGTAGGIGGVGGDGGAGDGGGAGAGDGGGSADGSAYERGGIVALQSGGFVFPADVVAAVGAGSSSAGLEALAKKFGAKPVAGKGHGQSDHIPAMIDGKRKARVARDEAVLDAAQVARIGGGDGKKGAQKLYDMMARVRKQSMGTTKQMRPVKLKELA